MNDWFRSWHNAPADPKWRTVAKRAGVKTGQVVAVIWSLLDRASQAHDRGSIGGFNPEILADALDWEVSEIQRIIDALTELSVIKDERFVAWSKYQPRREDGSAERAKEWRERNRTQPNASEPKEHRYREDTDTEKKIKKRKRADAPSAPQPGRDLFRDVFSQFPRKEFNQRFEAALATVGESLMRRRMEEWRDKPGCGPTNYAQILDVVVNGWRSDNGNGKQFKTRAERDLENIQAIARDFEWGDEGASTLEDHHESRRLLGPGDADD